MKPKNFTSKFRSPFVGEFQKPFMSLAKNKKFFQLSLKIRINGRNIYKFTTSGRNGTVIH